MKKCKTLLLLSVTGMLATAFPAVSASAAWKDTASGKMYTQDAQPGYLTGLQKIGDYTYYFNNKGIMQTGFQKILEQKYYFNEEGQLQFGRFVAPDGKTYYASKTYGGALLTNTWHGNCYYQADGSMAVNTVVDGKQVGPDGLVIGTVQIGGGWVSKGGRKYYYNADGTMVKGMIYLNGNIYYLNSSTGALQKGWFKVKKKTYYAKSDGALLTNEWKNGKYLLSSGAVATGWVDIGGKSYMFDSSGKRRSGWVKYQKAYYYCVNGVVQKGRWLGKKKYYVLDSGVRASGWLNIKDATYYFDPKSGVRKTGFIKNGSTRYYLNNKGKLSRNAWLSGKKYYATASGALANGLQNIDGSLYFFKKKTCIKIANQKKTINGSTYYFKKDGAAAMNCWVKLKSKYYYFLGSGAMAKNQWVGEYYVGPDGARTKDVPQGGGWQTKDGKKYYYNAQGVVATGWQTIDGKRYYFDGSGAAVTGLQTLDNKKYYFYPGGDLAVSTTIAVGAKYYTIDSSGTITGENTITISGNSVGSQIVNYAVQFIGNPYVYGGNNLTTGVDCSGFVVQVFAQFGIKMLRVADDQMKGPSQAYINQGYRKAVPVDYSKLENILPGDLIFYGANNYASHVGIYMGNGQIVHASNSQPYPLGGIKISDYDYQKPIGVVRYW